MIASQYRSARRSPAGDAPDNASALKWEDINEAAGVIHVRRKQVRGRGGRVTRRKRAPKLFPLEPQLAVILREHRQRLIEAQIPGLDQGWVFPSEVGTLRAPSSVSKAWATCLKTAGITKRFTPHGMRRTFNDQLRQAGVDPVTAKSLTGHVTEAMREHYGTVGIDEKRAAVASVLRRLPQGPHGPHRESADDGADAESAANDTAALEPAKAAT